MNNDWLEIVNIDKLVDFSRKLVYYNFDDKNKHLDDKTYIDKVNKIKNEEQDEINSLLPLDECKRIFGELSKTRINKKTKVKKLFIKENNYNEFLERLNRRMVSNIIQSLIRKGKLESAFDSEKNDFVFWVKE